MTYAPAPRVTRVDVIEPHTLAVGFVDGTEQRVDVEPLFDGEWFDALRDLAVLRSVQIDVHGSLVWPNGVSLSPWTLHDWPTEGSQLVETVRKQARQRRRLRAFQWSFVVAAVMWNIVIWAGWFGFGRPTSKDIFLSGAILANAVLGLVLARASDRKL